MIRLIYWLNGSIEMFIYLIKIEKYISQISIMFHMLLSYTTFPLRH